MVAGTADGVISLVLLAGRGTHAVLPTLVDQGLLPGRVLGAVLGLALDERLVGDAVAPHIALPGGQVDLHGPEQLPRTVHRPAQVRHAPADNGVGRLGDRAVELRGGGQQHLQGLLVGHVGITFHHQRQRAGGMGRCHRGAGLDPITPVRNGAVDQRAGGRNTPVLGDAAFVVFLVIGLIQPGHGKPVAFQFRLEIRQGRAHARVGIAAVAGAEHIDHASLGHVRCRVQPGATVVMLGIRRVHVVQGLVADVLGLAAPAVVDGAHAGVHQSGVHGLEVFGVRGGAEQEAVVGVGVAHKNLRVVGHAMHAHAVAGGAHGAGDVGAVGIIVRVERARGAEGAAIDIGASGGDRVETVFGGFGVIGIEP